MTVFAIVLIAILVIVIIVLVRGLLFAQRKEEADAATLLRELLLARAEGRIGAEEFETRQAALHAALLAATPAPKTAGKALRWAVPVAVLAIAAGLYVYQGKPQGIDSVPLSLPPAGSGAPAAASQANAGGDLNTMVKRLADKMAKDPNNGEGWLLLARTYGELHQQSQAAEAYARAAALLPPDAALLADWADAYVMSHDRKWDAEARSIVKRALKADPKHPKTLALAGSEAFDRNDYKAAIEYWKQMKAVSAADSMDAKLAEANIQEAVSLMTGKKGAEMAEVGLPGSLSGMLSVSPKFKDKIAAGDTVFVVAKATDGQGAPVAVRRYSASELPLEFTLDDTQAMLPGRTLSAVGEVVVSARVSKSGNATPQPGDVVSASIKAKRGSQKLKLELNTVL